MGELRLFIWENVLGDHPPGMAVALAHSVEEARNLVQCKILADHVIGDCLRFLEASPLEVATPKAFYCWGGD